MEEARQEQVLTGRLDHGHAKDLIRQLKNSGWFDQYGNPPEKKEFSLIGLLMKRRSGFGRHIGQRWVNRCFALKDGKLVYFESDTLSEVDWTSPRGVLDLTDPDVTYSVNRAFENAPTQHTLQIHVQSQTGIRWKLCAFTANELDSWANEIGKYCKAQQSPDIVPQPGATDSTSPRLNAMSLGSWSQDMRPSEMEGLPSPQQVQEEDHAPRTSFSPKPAHQPSPKRALPSSMLEEKDSDHVAQNNKPELKASSNHEQAPETTSMPPKHSKAAPPRIPGRRKRTKKPPQSGTFGFSKGTETLVILTSLNVFAYLLHILNGWHWYGLVVVLNCLCFQILKNKDQVDQWDEQTPSKRRASLVTATGEVRNMASIKNHKGQGQNAMGSVVPSELPRAGNTMIPVELTESEREAEEPPHHTPANTWSNGCGQHFTVRSKNYSKTKKKTPSGKALYNLVAADFFEVDARVNHIAADFQMPKASVEFSHSHIPQFIVVNVQLPSTAPSMMSSETDGPGYQVVHYFEIAPETVEELKHPDTASEGTRLLEEYCM